MPDKKCLFIQDGINLEVMTKRLFNVYKRKTKNFIRRLNLSDAWIKQTEKIQFMMKSNVYVPGGGGVTSG